MHRNIWKAIVRDSLEPTQFKDVTTLVEQAADAAQADEHGTWDFGASFNRRGRGQALNWDLYGMGFDVHSGNLLIAIQIRQATITKHFTNVRKNYFLVGTNEDNTTFAHPVSANVIHHAINTQKDVIRSIQNWIFQGDYDAMNRQGDIALLHLWHTPHALPVPELEFVLLDSHRLTAKAARKNGSLFLKDPIAIHLPGTHPTITGTGWHRVIVGKRADFWKFATPTAD